MDKIKHRKTFAENSSMNNVGDEFPQYLKWISSERKMRLERNIKNCSKSIYTGKDL